MLPGAESAGQTHQRSDRETEAVSDRLSAPETRKNAKDEHGKNSGRKYATCACRIGGRDVNSDTFIPFRDRQIVKWVLKYFPYLS